MKVTVVIPAYNEEKYIGACLDSILSQSRRPDEIIVVDNNSTDKTPEIIKKYKNVKYIIEKQQGIIPARNTGFDAASGDIIARCDADTILPRDWIKSIESSFLKNESTVAVSTPLLLHDIKFGNSSKLLFYAYMLIPSIVIGHYPLIGPSMAVRKSAWDKIKNELCLDPHEVHEDLDISFHIKKLGAVYHDSKNLVLTSGRRIRHNPKSFFGEYTWRFFKMLRNHR